MPKVLIQFAHPVLSKSRVQAALLRSAEGIPNVTINDLYERYPDLYIDVEREQCLLLKHDIVIFQHPFYWYSSPAIVKQWMDLVLEHNWAYGAHGTALAGKQMMNAISCGAPRDVYSPTGRNRFSINQFLAPFDQTAHLCKMIYLPPFVVHATNRIATDAVSIYAEQYRQLLTGLASGRITVDSYGQAQYSNDILPVPDGQPV